MSQQYISGGPIMFYDGDCALCSATVQFVLANDSAGLFRFAPLQGQLAAEVLPCHGRNPADLDTVCLLLNAGTAQEKLLVKSRAVLMTARLLGGWRAVLGVLGSLFPAALGDRFYDQVAARRHRLVRRKEQACWLPQAEYAGRFLD